MHENRICPRCMRRKGEGESICAMCGFDEAAYRCPPDHLPPGTVLDGKYMIGASVGEGGFGITYIALDIHLETVMAVKELFLRHICSRGRDLQVSCRMKDRALMEEQKDAFLREARVLAMLREQGVKGTVGVRDHFEENGTAYIVMEYLDGVTLQEYVKRNGPMTYEETMALLSPVLGALVRIQQFGVVHRDVSPENIMILRDGSGVLMDFGAAVPLREEGAAAFKSGYAPPEQCRAGGDTGPWTDVYAFAATVCFGMSGAAPADALLRISGEAPDPLDALPCRLSKRARETLSRALEPDPGRRFASADEFAAALPSRTASGPRLSAVICAGMAAAGILMYFLLSVSGPSADAQPAAQESAAGEGLPETGELPGAGDLCSGLDGEWYIVSAGGEDINWCVSRSEDRIIVWENVWDDYAVFDLETVPGESTLFRIRPAQDPARCLSLDPETGLLGLGDPDDSPWQMFRIRSCGEGTVLIHGHDETTAGLAGGDAGEGSPLIFAPYDTFPDEREAQWKLVPADG